MSSTPVIPSGSSRKSSGITMKSRRRLDTTWRLLVALLFIIYALFPIVFVISTSLNPSGSLQTTRIFPANPSLANYQKLLTSQQNPFLRWMLNSLIVSTTTAIITVALCAVAAYSFSRFRFRSRKRLLQGLLLSQVFPNVLAMVALYLILQQIGRYYPMFGLNTLGGLVLIYLGGAIGFNTWLMKGFFDTVPRDLDESAMLDGASSWQTFWTIILPLVRPVLAVIFMLSFIGTYGDYLLAKVMLSNTEKYTVAVGLSLFIGQQFGQRWGEFAAGAVVAAIPTLILFYISQSQLQGGLTSGSVKG
ncbi:MAG: sugar ABC transporter permease [Caldilineae bacterium]|nr:sugar ABC transporter permease [Anaerolineae bacterium]MCB0203598.1 sugar ABC transporter permease [Anaerolineae bacterium]MCB0257265.1 sugar ABC transporter permease [Anaerolineae bacterium]MCB9152819.1 sugar ABC transporter permease [Caldilineae bacterium]